MRSLVFLPTVLLAALTACEDLPPEPTAIRNVILFNDSAPTVTLARDQKAFWVLAEAVMAPDPTEAARAQMKAAELDGKLFKADNGTRADVLKEVPLGKLAAGVSVLYVRIRNGPRITEEGICLSSLTQPDSGK